MRRWTLSLSRGQGTVEFALIVPALVFVAFFALDLGRIFSLQIALTNAAREGARYCVMNPSAPGGLTARVDADLGSFAAARTGTPACVPGTGQTTVSLQASFQPITPFIGQLAGPSGVITVAASAAMPS